MNIHLPSILMFTRVPRFWPMANWIFVGPGKTATVKHAPWWPINSYHEPPTDREFECWIRYSCFFWIRYRINLKHCFFTTSSKKKEDFPHAHLFSVSCTGTSAVYGRWTNIVMWGTPWELHGVFLAKSRNGAWDGWHDAFQSFTPFKSNHPNHPKHQGPKHPNQNQWYLGT